MVLMTEIEETIKRLKKVRKDIDQFVMENPQNPKIKQVLKRKKRKRKLKEDIERKFICLV